MNLGLWWLLIIAVLCTAATLFFLSLVRMNKWPEDTEENLSQHEKLSIEKQKQDHSDIEDKVGAEDSDHSDK